jgi:imidazolonepropionase-like amidohydrolase
MAGRAGRKRLWPPAAVHGTSQAAELLGLAGTAGVIEPGATADIVAVTGHPLQDIECLQQVELVIQDGRVAWDGQHLTRDGLGASA